MLYILDKKDKIISIKSDFSDIIEDKMVSQLNGEESYTLTVDWSEENQQLLKPFNKIGFMHNGNFIVYVIKTITDIKETVAEKNVYCEHIKYELYDNIVEDVRPYDKDLRVILESALIGSEWVVGTVHDFGINSMNFYYSDSGTNLEEIANKFNCNINYELKLNKEKTAIESKIVNAHAIPNGVITQRFETGNNLDKIERVVDVTGFKTELIGRGKAPETDEGGFSRRILFDEIGWSVDNGNPVDKPVGQKWVGIPSLQEEYGSLRGVYECEAETPEELLSETYHQLLQITKDNISYKVEVPEVNLNTGDVVAVIDHELSLYLESVVIETSSTVFSDGEKSIILGNFKQTITGEMMALQNNFSTFNNAYNETVTELDVILNNNVQEVEKVKTDISELEEQLKDKVAKDEVSGLIEVSPLSIQIGFNKIDNIVQRIAKGMRINHNGAFSLLDENGLTYCEKEVLSKYLRLACSISFTTTQSINDLVWIQLPDVFKGKDLTIQISLSDSCGSAEEYREGWVTQRTYLNVKEVDNINAKVGISGYKISKNYKTEDIRSSGVIGRILVLA